MLSGTPALERAFLTGLVLSFGWTVVETGILYLWPSSRLFIILVDLRANSALPMFAFRPVKATFPRGIGLAPVVGTSALVLPAMALGRFQFFVLLTQSALGPLLAIRGPSPADEAAILMVVFIFALRSFQEGASSAPVTTSEPGTASATRVCFERGHMARRFTATAICATLEASVLDLVLSKPIEREVALPLIGTKTAQDSRRVVPMRRGEAAGRNPTHPSFRKHPRGGADALDGLVRTSDVSFHSGGTARRGPSPPRQDPARPTSVTTLRGSPRWRRLSRNGALLGGHRWS